MTEVATDNEREEFLTILREGSVSKGHKSNYAVNYEFFQRKIDAFLNEYPSYFAYFPTRILQNCILLPIEAESQDTALRIFSTLNDRGKPLSDADIFKAQFYKFFSEIGKKDEFIKQWKALEERCEKIFHPTTGTPMDELFSRYMYFIQAKEGNKSTTTEALRKFYERNNYQILRDEGAFQDDRQMLLPIETVLEIEHIYARNRQDKEQSLSDVRSLELLGNKALLEKRINISASDYRLGDKD